MANEYGELEQLVNDVTSLDTARMTLRWALERLNTIEKEKADLKKNLTIAEEAAKKLQLKDASLKDAFDSRSKTLEEKEDFYTKLEATMSLLGEGKLDIQQLLKKEAKLDSLRKSLEDEYQSKFEDLDRNQRSVIERWNGRLLEVESQYAGRLAEAQKKYDSLRTELEADYQGRMTALQASFKAREKELSDRIGSLEGNVRLSEEKVETRRRELEAEYLLKKRETEENYRKLKTMLEAGLDEKLRSMDSDHSAQVRSLEASWQTERSRLLEEQRIREAQFVSAQERIKEIENKLASQQEVHHTELIKIISEKETAFRAQISELEKEKGLKEAAVKELVLKLEGRSSAWAQERAALEAEFGRKLAGIEATMSARVSEAERAYAERSEEAEKTRARSLESVKAMESELAAVRERHNSELMERVQAGEAAFREKLEAFEGEKRSYNETINKLTASLEEAAKAYSAEKENFRSELARMSAQAEVVAEERTAAIRADYEARKTDLEKDFGSRYGDRLKALEAEKARMNEALAEREGQLKAAFDEARKLDAAMAELRMKAVEEKAALSREYESEMNGALKAAENAAKVREAELASDIETLRGEIAERDRLLAQEKAKLVDELSKAAIDAHNRGEARAEAVKAEYEARLASLESAAENRVSELKELIAEKETALQNSYSVREAAEKALKDAFAAEKAGWSEERARLAAEFDKRLAELEAGLSDRTASIRQDYETRKADLEKDFSSRYGDRLKALEAEKARMGEVLAEREGELKASFAEARRLDAALAELRMKAAEEKAALSREYESEMNKALKASEAAAKGREAELAADIEVLRGEIAERDRLLAQEKAKLVDELSKAAIDAHNRGEERAAAVRTEYEAKLAALESSSAEKIGDLRRDLTEKEALIDKLYAERSSSEAAIKADFERKRAELEAELSRRTSALEADYAAHKERLAGELAVRTESIRSEEQAKSAFERRNWDSERTRLERALMETSEHFRSAQKDIEELNKSLRRSEEANTVREAELSREMMEAKSNFDKELAYRVKDAVSIQTAHLVEALEASKAKQEELYKHIEAKDEALRTARTEAEEARRIYENKILDASSGALKERREELERHYAAKSAALEEEMSSFRRIMESENETLRAAMEQAREEVLAANKRADDTFNDMLKASKAVQEEKLEINRLRTDEFNAAVADAVRKAVEAAAQKLRHAESELVRIQGINRDEVSLLTEAFNKEKDRMLEEIVRRENYLESADLKIQELEQQMASLKQNASMDLLKNVSEQDKRFREMVSVEKGRHEDRVKQLEDLLSAKERLLADGERIYRQKQAELDAVRSELNASVSRSNEDLFAQRQALGEKEKALNDFRLKLEKDYAAKAADLEKMRTELARAIVEYKGRK